MLVLPLCCCTGRLTGKRAVITGGDSGIGRAVAIAFAREGLDVSISYLPEEEKDAQETVKWIKVCTVLQLRDAFMCYCNILRYPAIHWRQSFSATSLHGVPLMKLDCSRETRA
jgi:NAD(P)-dependent dehydrogenase (short-subunit alcohol dehydrogenase family)